MTAKLDLQVQKILTDIANLNLPDPRYRGVEATRQLMNQFTAVTKPTEIDQVENIIAEIDVDSNGGPSLVPLRIYRPNNQSGLPCILFFHGGGWVLGNLDTHDEIARKVAKGTDCIVIAVDYRLAPEHPYPHGFNDCYASLCWVFKNAEKLLINQNKIALYGDSAGGQLASAVSLRARDEGGPGICFQSLVYPVTNLKSFDTESYSSFSQEYNLKKSDMQWFRQLYLGIEFEQRNDLDSSYLSPQLSNDLANLPKTAIHSAGFDVLRDEAELFAKALIKSGTNASYYDHESLVHGFMSMSALVPAANEALQKIVNQFKNELCH